MSNVMQFKLREKPSEKNIFPAMVFSIYGFPGIIGN